MRMRRSSGLQGGRFPRVAEGGDPVGRRHLPRQHSLPDQRRGFAAYQQERPRRDLRDGVRPQLGRLARRAARRAASAQQVRADGRFLDMGLRESLRGGDSPAGLLGASRPPALSRAYSFRDRSGPARHRYAVSGREHRQTPDPVGTVSGVGTYEGSRSADARSGSYQRMRTTYRNLDYNLAALWTNIVVRFAQRQIP